MKHFIRIMAFFFLIGLIANGSALALESRVKELARLGIEELMHIKVISVLKTPQSLLESPAAVHVIHQEDIRRSGAENIPDLLRMIPGVQVAELDVNIYAISIRGFNDIHANKLLVMVDGRSVYNHIFSGVIWSHLGVFMEDIERIEIIRGPGSSVWGANAVNGVVNIITKKSQDAKGAFIEFSAGRPDIFSARARYGGDMSSNGAFRIYAKGFQSKTDHLSQPGFDSETRLDSRTAGFRADWDFGKSNDVSLQGGVIHYEKKSKENNPQPLSTTAFNETRNAHLSTLWRCNFSEQSKAEWRLYYQNETREGDYAFDVIDLDFQHDVEWIEQHRFVWGLGYRFISDEMIQGLLGNYTYNPRERKLHLFSLFVQDTVELSPDTLSLTAGSKLEHNDYTGFEVQPGIRLIWMPHERHTFWGAVSRAVRTPSRVDSDAETQSQAFLLNKERVIIKGSADFEAEDLLAYEIGFRANPINNLWFDIATFYNMYDNLSAYEETKPGIWTINNDMEGDAWGLEISVDYQPVKWWRLGGAWSFLEMDMRLKNDRAADLTGYLEHSNPSHQFALHSAMDLGHRVEFDIRFRLVDSVLHQRPSFAVRVPGRETGGYATFDARLAWQPLDGVELSIIGRNLGGTHQEFTQYEVEESLFFNVAIQLGD